MCNAINIVIVEHGGRRIGFFNVPRDVEYVNNIREQQPTKHLPYSRTYVKKGEEQMFAVGGYAFLRDKSG